MGRFSDRMNEIAGNSRFTQMELKSLFTPEEEETVMEVKRVLEDASDDNDASVRIQSMGYDGIKVLAKIARKTLVG